MQGIKQSIQATIFTKFKIKFSLLLTLCLLSTAFFSIASVYAAAPSVWIQNASDRAFQTSTMPTGATTAITLYAARNEYQAAQILVRSSSSQSNLFVTANALTGPGGATIPASSIKVTMEVTHMGVWEVPGDFEIPPGGNGNGSADYTDSLEDNTPQTIAANVTQPYYYSVYTSPTQTPGTYTGTAVVNSSGGNVTVNVTVVVYNVTIPPANQSTFKMNNWFGSAGWDFAGTEKVTPLQYNVTMYDANWWTVIANIAANHAKHRNNVIHADFHGLLIPDTTIDISGNITFGWATFDRFVQTFIDAGALQYIYAPQQIQHIDDLPKVDILVRNANGATVHDVADPDTPVSNAYLDKLFPALKAHLDAKGWTNKFYMSAEDEPANQAQVNAANWYYSKYKAVFGANAPTNEAHYLVWSGMENNLTTYTPTTNAYNENTAFYQKMRIENGKDLWLYTAIGPQDNYMNRFLSYHLDKTRLIPWLGWKVGAVGYLHWGWNYWVDWNGSAWTAPDTERGDGHGFGDWWLVRPNKPAYDIYDSVRSENQLYGLQDYELLNILKQTKPLVAKSITESLITNFTVYTRSGANVETAHKQILDEIVSAQSDTRFAFFDDFSSGNDGNWVHTLGTWSVSGGEYSQTNASQWQAVSAVKGRSYGDFALTFDTKIVNDGGNHTNWAGAVVRSANGTDVDTGYLIALRNNGKIFIYRSGTTLAEVTVPGYVAGQYTTVKVVTNGNNIQVFAGNNATALLNVNDSGFSAGNIALITASSAKFDNVVINAEQNYAEGKAVSVSSSYTADGWSPQAAVDGRKSTITNSAGWSSNNSTTTNHSEWVAVDLGKSYNLSRVDLYPRNDGAQTGYGFPIDFTIQTSTDNVNWTTVVTQTGYGLPGNAVQSFPFTSVNARYVKVNGTNLRLDNQSSYRMQFAEIQVFGGNLAAGKTVTASSSYESASDGWGKANATDGARLSNIGYSMGWSSNNTLTSNHTEWVTVDLGGSSKFNTVSLLPRNDGASTGYFFPIDFTIQTSPDNVNWTTVVTQTGYAQPSNAVQAFTFASTTARYVKINATNLRFNEGAYRMQFAEIEVK
ncbi:discoidin domain-containing protein [Cohnella silvisoli]|uniref:Discoidin domain-containing protein n=1 Tax=Cohnella silvisoli TaxID=2873699 RepID=A0ABV1KZ37_9BACL|nr:discoidin domain-containing protein [Cohnella silvisoli]MCD9024225.1 discoidin domain-containing protein [Cohnella silvisoli]